MKNIEHNDTLVTEMSKAANLTAGSWEAKLIGKCYSSLSIKPRKGDALLFYSQTPDGLLDEASLHGACPILKGQKWAANLWVWNACRWSRCKNPMNPAGELPPSFMPKNRRSQLENFQKSYH